MKTISRIDAKQAGFVRFFTGVPCKHGHVSERFVSDGGCVKCKAEGALSRYHKNPLPVKEYGRKWSKDNSEKRNAYNREWRKANPDKAACHAAAQREKLAPGDSAYRKKMWRAENPERMRFQSLLYGSVRRAALLNRTPAWSDLKAIEEVYRDASEFRQAGVEVDVDHIIPLQGELVSGLHVPGNLRVCLSSVNRSKSNQFHVHI